MKSVVTLAGGVPFGSMRGADGKSAQAPPSHAPASDPASFGLGGKTIASPLGAPSPFGTVWPSGPMWVPVSGIGKPSPPFPPPAQLAAMAAVGARARAKSEAYVTRDS